ncbi:MAG: hypothetical protein R6X06_05380 [Gammaproteobacteria bacterium]
MKRKALAVLIPPLAVCRYGCASCCAAPIGVFWITGIIGIVYGYLGGPAALETVSWVTMGLGLVLWALAAIWAETTIRGVEADQADPKCQGNASTVCRIVRPKPDESDPMDEIKKFRS